MIVSGGRQRDSAIHLHVSILPIWGHLGNKSPRGDVLDTGEYLEEGEAGAGSCSGSCSQGGKQK